MCSFLSPVIVLTSMIHNKTNSRSHSCLSQSCSSSRDMLAAGACPVLCTCCPVPQSLSQLSIGSCGESSLVRIRWSCKDCTIECFVAFLLTQAVSCIIPLKELQKMQTLRPVSDGGLPGIELNYGSAANPKTMWLELSQVRSAQTYSFLLAIQKLPSTT